MICSRLLLPILLLASACSVRMVPAVNSVDTTSVDFSDTSAMRKGMSCQDFVFGFIPVGDEMSLFDAVKDARIRRVAAVEYDVTSYVVFAERCLVVYGDDQAPTSPAAPAPPPPPPAPLTPTAQPG